MLCSERSEHFQRNRKTRSIFLAGFLRAKLHIQRRYVCLNLRSLCKIYFVRASFTVDAFDE